MDKHTVQGSINSKSYWNAKFHSKDWERQQGKEQTLFYGQLAIDHMPDWLKSYISTHTCSICDFGCALGQATQLLATTFHNSEVTGQDISESAIAEAKKLFPRLTFMSDDLLASSEKKYDIMFSSNTLEHFYNPHEVINQLAHHARQLLILLIPFYDDLKIEEHFYSFTYKNIPRFIGDAFSLVFYKDMDTSRVPNTHWMGRQLLMIYAEDSLIDALKMDKSNPIPEKVSAKEGRLAVIDSILSAESDKQELEQSLAQGKHEHPTTKQQLEKTKFLGKHAMASSLQRETYRGGAVIKKVGNLAIIYRYIVNQLRYPLYKLYLKSPTCVKNFSRMLYNRKFAIDKPIKESTAIAIDADHLNFIHHVRNAIDISNTIFYIQRTIMNFSGDEFYLGGAERYALDLNKLVVDMGYRFICIQKCAHQPWIRNYYGATIIGLPNFVNGALFQRCASLLVKHSKLIISSPFTIMSQQSGTKNIGISHGMYWDHASMSHAATLIASRVKDCDRVVSVDTATVNFIRAHHPSYACHMDYIPNYVDHDLFTVGQNNHHPSEINILYPRRLYGPRGFWVVCKVLPEILHAFDNVKFIFCGKGGDNEMNEIRKLEKKYSGRVKNIFCQPYDMHTIYQNIDIVLIPTIHSEGTSLSLIEAMASKKAIIATCVGGLTDLVTDRFTGILIKPNNTEELRDAIKELIMNEPLRKEIAENAYKKSFAFGINIWQKKWRKTIESVMDSPVRDPLNHACDFSFLHLHINGIVFNRMRQRPQQFFTALSKHAKCFFVEDRKGDSQQFIHDHLILSGKNVQVDMSGMICYTYLASHLNFIKNRKYQLLIYDILDHPTIHNSQRYLKQHQEMLKLASIIITSSTILFKEYNTVYKEKIIKYIPNAVFIEDFSKAITHNNPDDFPAYGEHKIIGYYGAIAEWFDYELIGKTASTFSDALIILMGPCRTGFPEEVKLNKLLRSHHNLFYLGEKEYSELPAYAHLFDVSIIPFIINEITLNCSPVQLFEYMAVGAPIVTTDMPECRQYKSALVAKDQDEFISLIDKSLKLPKEDEYFTIMKEEAEHNTWDARAQVIIEAVHENLNASR